MSKNRLIMVDRPYDQGSRGNARSQLNQSLLENVIKPHFPGKNNLLLGQTQFDTFCSTHNLARFDSLYLFCHLTNIAYRPEFDADLELLKYTIDRIRKADPFSRATIYSFGALKPSIKIITDVQPDSFLSGPLGYHEARKFFNLGPINGHDIARRGLFISLINSNSIMTCTGGIFHCDDPARASIEEQIIKNHSR